MNKNFIILLLVVLLIFALVNNYIMYRRCYYPYSTNVILDKLPNDVTYSNYVVFYKMSDQDKCMTGVLTDKSLPTVGLELDKHVDKFKDKYVGHALVYSSYGKLLELTGGLIYDIKNNLIG